MKSLNSLFLQHWIKIKSVLKDNCSKNFWSLSLSEKLQTCRNLNICLGTTRCFTINYLILAGAIVIAVCSYHVTYAFENESTHCSCLNVNELLAQSRRNIRSLSDCSRTRTHNNLICKRTLSHPAKLVKWLSCVVSTYYTVHLTVCSYIFMYAFRLNPYSTVAWMSRNSLLKTSMISEV